MPTVTCNIVIISECKDSACAYKKDTHIIVETSASASGTLFI